MQSLTTAPPTAASHTSVRRVLIAVLVTLALGLWLAATTGMATPAEADPLASHSWVG